MSLNNPISDTSLGQPLDQSVVPSHGQTVIRFVLVYAFFHILFALLDIWTTWVGVRLPYLDESNPYTDLSSIYTLSMPNVILLFIGSLGVGLCAYIRRQRIAEIAGYSYPKFVWSICTFHLEFVAINLVVMAFARFIIVINNLSCIAQYYCPISHEYIFGHLTIEFFLMVFCAHMLSWWPVSYLMYRVLRMGRWT